MGTIEKGALALFLLGVMAIGGLVWYYRWERQSQSSGTLMERTTQQLEEQVRSDPYSAANRLRVANAYVQTGRYDAAIEQFEQVLVIRPDDLSALAGLGMAHILIGDSGEAAENFSRVIELTKGQEFARVDSRVFTSLYYLGKLRLDAGQTEEAIGYLTEAHKAQASNADVLNLLGTVYQKQGNHREAIGYFGEALRYDPAFAEAYRGLAESHKAEGDNNKSAYADAMAALFSGQVDGAVSRLESLVPTYRDADVYWGLGWAYEKKGQKEKAISAYQNALDIDPNQGMAFSGLRRLTGGEVRP